MVPGSSRWMFRLKFIAYGVAKFGLVVLIDIGSKNLKFTVLSPGRGGVNGNLLGMDCPVAISVNGLANDGLPPTSPIPPDTRPKGGARRFCKATSSSVRLK